MLLDGISYPTYTTIESYVGHCYSQRTFDRFLSFFGGVRIEQERGMDTEKFVVKGDVFHKLFEFGSHKSFMTIKN